MDWKKLLAYITGSVDQELLLRNEYLAAANRILRNQLNMTALPVLSGTAGIRLATRALATS